MNSKYIYKLNDEKNIFYVENILHEQDFNCYLTEKINLIETLIVIFSNHKLTDI